ncbi:MAG TPA: hypothetical protein VE974_06280 [Thermoanaerobaculia bacterium]|nr:hypothetical protein [Thermoanaerobaculia bacterium]
MQIEPVHWTTYAALIVSVLSVVGTFIYVWFTYNLMKLAVGQGRSATAQANVAVFDHVARQSSTLRRIREYAMELMAEAEVTLGFMNRGDLSEHKGRGILESMQRNLQSAVRTSAEIKRLETDAELAALMENIAMVALLTAETASTVLKEGLESDKSGDWLPGFRRYCELLAKFSHQAIDMSRALEKALPTRAVSATE